MPPLRPSALRKITHWMNQYLKYLNETIDGNSDGTMARFEG